MFRLFKKNNNENVILLVLCLAIKFIRLLYLKEKERKRKKLKYKYISDRINTMSSNFDIVDGGPSKFGISSCGSKFCCSK